MLEIVRAEELESHRDGLTGYCYRMLGSAFEAEDAVQETLLRGWKSFDQYDPARGSLRTWLFGIATNICVDMMRSTQRRARAMDLGPPTGPGPEFGEPLPEQHWVQPIPDSRVLTATDPAELAAQRETIRLAFIAALQHLPPRQRAVLILRDVLHWHAAEVAGLLDTTVASINSALQRARATLAKRPLPAEPLDAEHRDLLARYVTAFQEHDVATLTALLHEDATSSMPPFQWWVKGRSDHAIMLNAPGAACDGARLVPTSANGCPAFGQYLPTGEPMALVVLEISGGLITDTTTFLDTGLFPMFGLPMSFTVPVRTS